MTSPSRSDQLENVVDDGLEDLTGLVVVEHDGDVAECQDKKVAFDFVMREFVHRNSTIPAMASMAIIPATISSRKNLSSNGDIRFAL